MQVTDRLVPEERSSSGAAWMRWRSRRRSEMNLDGLHILIALRHLLRTTLSACSRCLLPPIKRHGLIANAAGEV